MTLSGDVVWLGPLAAWSADLNLRVRAMDGPTALADLSEKAALVVLDGRHVEALADWLARPSQRPPVLVFTDAPDAETAALRAGAEGVVSPGASVSEAERALQHALARHHAAGGEPELYRLVVESATDLIVVVDGEGRVVFASPSAAERTGYTPAELAEAGAFGMVHPEDVTEVAAVFSDAIAEPGAVRSLRYRVRTKAGDVRFMEGVGRAVVGPGGAPYGIVIARDVTNQKAMEDRLVASEARYRTVVRALPDVISRIRLDGLVLDFHVPPVFETEFPAEALIGRRLQDEIPADLAAKFDAGVARVRETGDPISYDYAVRVGGETKHREVRLAPLGDDEVISMLRDVTALREHEAALERSRTELRALATHLQDVREEERARLSREVHDVLGQQLTAVRLGVGWFGRHYPDDAVIQARVEEIRETIDETIHHARRIAADLRPGILDDFGLASAVEWEARRFEEWAGLTCTVEVEGDGGEEPPPDVATAAFRVLQEALTNVARHAGAETVAVTLHLAPDAVRLVVADDGQGFRGAPEAGRRPLGLLGMRERARALGGAVEVRSGPGRGAVVECTFPLPTENAAAP